ncbi:DUF4258 domain-containing protein [Patescibacteria group bacterium]|nr:DUF4258 domain-containing protein [Patescibacteria group bacterium]
MKVVYSPHARKRMKLRGITAPQVRTIIDSPSATVKQANGRIKAVGTLANGNALMVIYKETKSKIIIVTTY